MKCGSSLKRLMVVACLLLTACAATGPATEVVDTGCYWAAPIYVSQADDLTDETASQILAHNLTWERRCREVGNGR